MKRLGETPLLMYLEEMRQARLEKPTYARGAAVDVGVCADRSMGSIPHGLCEIGNGSRHIGRDDSRSPDLGWSSAMQAHDGQTSSQGLRNHESAFVVDAREEENIRFAGASAPRPERPGPIRGTARDPSRPVSRRGASAVARSGPLPQTIRAHPSSFTRARSARATPFQGSRRPTNKAVGCGRGAARCSVCGRSRTTCGKTTVFSRCRAGSHVRVSGFCTKTRSARHQGSRASGLAYRATARAEARAASKIAPRTPSTLTRFQSIPTPPPTGP